MQQHSLSLTLGLLSSLCLVAGCNQSSVSTSRSGEETELSELVDAAELDVLTGSEASRLNEIRSQVSAASAGTSAELSAQYDLGFYLNELGKHGLDQHRDEAIEAFERCLALVEDGVVASGVDQSQVMAGIAFTYYTDWSNTSPDDPSHEAKGKTAWDRFNSVADMYRADEFWLGLMVTNHNRALVAEGLGDIESAIGLMEEAVRLDKEHGLQSYREFNRDYLAILRAIADNGDCEPSDEPKSR